MLPVYEGYPTFLASDPFHFGRVRPARFGLFLRFQRLRWKQPGRRLHDLVTTVPRRLQPDTRVRRMREQRRLLGI